MQLAQLVIEDLRLFGSRADQKHLDLPDRPGQLVHEGRTPGQTALGLSGEPHIQAMSVFTLHSEVLDDYRDIIRSFFCVSDDRAREFIERELVAEARLWPEALLQVSRFSVGSFSASPALRVSQSFRASETFRVLNEKETTKFCEYRTRRFVLEAWDNLPPQT